MVPIFLLAALVFFLTLHWFFSPFRLPAQAETEQLLFQETFSRTAGPPNRFTETFYLPAHVGPPFLLRIDNGERNGTKRISSATLALNGVQVVSPSEFSQRVATIHKEVDLQYGPNTLRVSLASTPGALITVTITGTVTIPPSLDTVEPDTEIAGESPQVNLTGSNTNFQEGSTEATFGPNISVGNNNNNEEAFGLVTVASPTSATADIAISVTAAFGPRTVTVRTGAEEVSKADAFTVVAPGPVAIAETTVSTIAGAGAPGFADDQGTNALFDGPRGIGRDMHGNLYVADTNNHVIRKITPDGMVSTLAGSGIPGLVNGMGTEAQFNSPEGVVAAPDGTVYVADTHNHVIRRITPVGMVTILAGAGIPGFQDGAGSTAQFDTPRSIALRWDGLLVVGDEGNNRVRLVSIDPDPAAVTVGTLAGSGTRGFQNGLPGQAQFASLAGVAADADHNVYVADTANQVIRKIAATDGTVSTFAGTGVFGFADGPALDAQFADPSGVTVDRAGNVYVADTFNSLIRRIRLDGQVETVAGTGVRGAEDGPGTAASFHTPQGLVTGSAVFIADTGNHKIRLIQIGPIISSLDPSSGVQDSTFTLVVTGTNLAGANQLAFLKDGVEDTIISASNLDVNFDGTELKLTASVMIAPTAAIGPRVVTVTTPSGTSSDMASAANTFLVLGRLILTPDPLAVAVGEEQTLTVSILNLAPADGVSVALTSAGPTIATVTSPVTIPEGSTSTTVTVTGVAPGLTNITASASGFEDAIVGVDVTIPVPLITSFTPGSGKIGDTVTIIGTGFGPAPAGNTVSFTGDNDTRISTDVTSASSTQLVVAVPEAAVTGPLQVTTDGGTATSTGHFIVLPSLGFTLGVVPDSVQVIEGSEVSFSISAAGEDGFAGLISLAVGSLPNGLIASFSPPQIAPGGIGTLTVTATAGAGSGSFAVTGNSVINGTVLSRQRTVSVNVSPAGITALRGRVLDIDLNPVQGVTLTLNNNTAHSTTTDAAGNFLLQHVPAGADQFLFIDGSTAIPDRKYPTFPALVTIQAGQVNTLPFLPFLHPQKATGFVDISNSGVERVVTDPDLPGVELRIPAGVRIVGWDGQANTKVSVRTVDLDRMPLPHPDPPIAARSAYFFYFDKVGGGTPLNSAGAVQPVPFTAPNDLGLPPGAQAELWYYDEGPTPESAEHRWKLAGLGTVSDDGTTISTDPGVGVPRFCCGAVCFSCRSGQCAAADRPRREGSSQGGEPVDLNTGVFVLDKTDMVIPGRIPLSVTRTYRTLESAVGIFGIGWSANLDIALRRSGNQITLVLPGSTEIPFSLQPDGTYAPVSDPGHLGSRITVASTGATLRSKDGTQMTFPAFIQNFAQLRSIVDRNGNTMTVSRDSIGRVTAISDDAGRQITFEYTSALGPVSRIRDPLGRTVQYEYDQNRLVRVTDPAGGVTRYTYDAQGRMASITDPREITFLTNHYSASGRVIRQVQADGGEWHFAYMLSGAQVTGPGCPGPTCPEVESLDTIQHGFTFRDGFVVATMLTDPRGDTTTYRFNNFGDLIEQIDALGQSVKFERAFGTNLLLSTTDPLGRVTRFTYDASGNVETITDPAGHVRTFTYELTFNKLTSITDPLGNVTQFAYDTNGNLVNITDPLGHVTQIAYNEFGQPIATTDPLGNVTQFEYDTVGNLVSIMAPLGNTTTRTYDLASRLIAQIDPRRKRTRFSYDELNRITEIVDALQGVAAFTYDGNGNLLTGTDARGSVTTHAYDSMDRLAMRTDPLGREEFYQYDLNGNLIQVTDRKGQVSTFTYDPLDRRTRSDFADGTFTQFTFDAAGRLIRASDSQTGTIIEEYDLLDRLIRETTPQGTISYAYDPLGRRTTMTVDGQSPVAYTYDAASRLRSITQTSVLSPVTIDYDALGRRTLLTLPNTVSTEYQYDPASRLTALIYRNAFGLLGDLTYEYDPAGNRTAVGGSFARTLLPDPILTSTYDAANQQLSFGDKTMTFDANGNLETLTDPTGTTTFTWDPRNRLIALSGPALTAAFQYDAFGRRNEKVASTITARYQYDDLNIVRESLDEVDVTYLGSLNIDEVFVRTNTSLAQFYLADALRSTIMLTDGAGASVTGYTYEPFGRSLASGTPSANTFQFTGRENDLTGLYYYRARYYHPALARFMSEDPLRTFNGACAYRYVANNPLTFGDSIGLLEFSTFGGLTGRVVTPFGGFDLTGGFRSGTNSGHGRVELYGAGRAFPAGGASVGRGFFFGAALRDASKISKLSEAFVDSPLGSISLLFDGNELVGIAVGGPSFGLGAGLALPQITLEESIGIDFPTDLSDILFGEPPAETGPPPVLSGRKP